MNNQWKLVPVELTEEMRSAANSEFGFGSARMLRAAIAAAPVPPQGDAQPVAVIQYMGYESANHLNWLNNNELQRFPDGTNLYTHPDAGEVVRLTAERDALQLRLNAADLRIDELTEASADRSPEDYAVEHAEYMAKSADHVLAQFQAYGLALLAADERGDEGDGELFEAIDSARQDLKEALVDLRGMVFEFRKRASRITPQ